MAHQVELITGPARAGKTARLLDEFVHSLAGRKNLSGRNNHAWISPTAREVREVQNRLAMASDSALLAPGVTTFAQFAESLAGDNRHPIRALTRLQIRHILQSLIQTLLEEGKLKHSLPVARSAGFLAEVQQTIAELKRRDVWAEDFATKQLGRLERDLSTIYSAYQKVLVTADLYDAEGRFWAAREQLANSSQQWGTIVVDGFSDFTAAQYDIVRLLAKRCERLAITLTLDRDDNDGRSLLFAQSRATSAKLKTLLPGLQVRFFDQQIADNQPALARLRQHLFGKPTSSTTKDASGLEIVAASSPQGEVEEVARRVKRLLVEQHVLPGDVLVVFCHLDRVAQRVAQAMQEAGIPIWCESRQQLGSTGLARLVGSLLQLHLDDWPFQQLLSLAGNRHLHCFDRADDPTTRPRVALDRALRSAQIPSGREAILDHMHLAASAPPTNEPSINDSQQQAGIARSFLRQLAECLDQLPEHASIEDWIKSLDKLLTDLGAHATSESDRAIAAWQQNWAALVRGLRALDLADRWTSHTSSRWSVRAILEALEMVGTESKVALPYDAVGRVPVLSIDSARHASAPYVFLAGLEEQAFSDPPRRHSAAMDETISAEQRSADALLLFYQLVTRATKTLTLSYTAMDNKGQSLPPSPLLTEVERLLDGTKLTKTTQTLDIHTTSEVSPTSRREFRLAAVSEAMAGQTRWLAAMVSTPRWASVGESILAGIQSAEHRRRRETFGPHEGVFASGAARAVLAAQFDSKHLWSPSQLETYAACPFRFFAEQILRLRPLEDLTLQNDAARRGSLLHQVLATVHLQLAEATESTEPKPLLAEELVERFRRALEAAVADAPLDGLAQALREIERREIESWAQRYAEQEARYRAEWEHLDRPLRPAFFEIRFGPQARSLDSQSSNASNPIPFELDLGQEQILLTGQIDRVDLGEVAGLTVFNIIDYKSGQEVRFKAEHVRAGRQLQLPLYTLAVEQHLLADQQPYGLAAGYWNVKAQGFYSSGQSGPLALREVKNQALQTTPQWSELQGDLRERVSELVDGVRRGHFPVFNDDPNCTRSCAYRTICRIAQVRSLDKVWEPSSVGEPS